MLGAPSYAVKGVAGVPMVSSWENARSSAFLMMVSSSGVNRLSCAIELVGRPDSSAGSAHSGAE